MGHRTGVWTGAGNLAPSLTIQVSFDVTVGCAVITFPLTSRIKYPSPRTFLPLKMQKTRSLEMSRTHHTNVLINQRDATLLMNDLYYPLFGSPAMRYTVYEMMLLMMDW